MGVVYRATDTKLNRDVAIKVLPGAFTQDPGRLARFAREAQVLASLNHPNIAAIYGVEDRALVMELVEGPTLAERIAEGPIPLEEALAVARQIAEALEYAHEHGVIHRDLKPANIKFTADGRVKVLDFGLAKAMASEPALGHPESSPTLTISETRAGLIVGTAAYMSPEQARGNPVDRRTDIWAFGVVLYEMLTGARLFEGKTISDTLAAVLTKEPDWDAIPNKGQRLLRSCLEKDAKRRLRDIGDAWRLLEDAAEAQRPGPQHRKWGWLAAGVLALTTIIACWMAWRGTRPVDHPLLRLNVDLGPDAVAGPNLTAVISPDGRRLVFPVHGQDGKQQLATRLLDQPQTLLLRGTENGGDAFFSPDGQWIGFFAEGKLKKISVQGGAAVTLCDAGTDTERGGTWGEDGSIIFARALVGPLLRVPGGGGTPQAVTKPANGENYHHWPQALPGGQTVLFSARTRATTAVGGDGNIAAASLKTGEIKVLQRGGYFGRYLPSGHLLYVHEGVLFGVAFNAARLEVRGTPVPLLEDVAGNPTTGGGQFAFSQTGTLVYLAGKSAAQTVQVVWLDSFGKTQPLVTTPGVYSSPRFSPDGKRLALATTDIFVYDWQREAMTRLTFSGGRAPVWTPDGKHIAFQSDNGGISWIRSDGAGKLEQLTDRRNSRLYPSSFSPDGRRLAYFGGNLDTGYDLWTLPLDLSDPDRPKPGTPEPFLLTPANELLPAFSPDGRWIAYRSDESGTEEIYVRPFPGPGGKWQISTGGGLYGIWSKNGRELFYETQDNRIMVVDYTANGDSFAPGKPRLWTDTRIFFPGRSNLGLAPDGKRFAVLQMPETTGETKGPVRVTFLLNFFDEVRRRIPAGGQ